MIYEQFKYAASIFANKTAVVVGQESYTFRGVEKLVEDCIESIKAEGCSFGADKIRNNVQSVALMLACAYLKMPLLVVPPDFTKKAEDELVERAYGGGHLPNWNPFLIFQSSGTTGEPKLIALSEETKWKRITQFVELYDIKEDDTLLVGTSLYLSLATRIALVGMCRGCTIRILERYSPEKWAEEAERCTVVAGVPQQIAHLIESEHLGKVRLVLSASAPLGECSELARWFKENEVEFQQCYGASEVAMVASGPVKLPGIVGKPVPGADVIADPELGVLVKCPTAFGGYWRQSEAWDPAAWFPTGDSGFFNEDGELCITGRIADLIRVGGHTVNPQNVDAVVMRELSAQIYECASFGVPDEKLGEVVAVAVVVKDPALTERWVQHVCFHTMQKHEIPRKVYFVKEIPKTPSGKVMRRVLKEILK